MLKSATARKRLVFLTLSAASGALFARSGLFGTPVSFSAIFTAVLPLPYGVCAAIGAILAGAFALSRNVLPLVASIAAALISKLRGQGQFPSAAAVSGAYLLSSAALCAFSGGSLADFAAIFGAAAVLFLATVFCFSAYSGFSSAKSVTPAQMVFLCGFVCSSLAPVEILTVPLGGIAAGAFILFAASRFGAACAVSVAAASALGAGLYDPRLYAVYAVLCVPAIISGLFCGGSPLKASTQMTAAVLPSALIFGGRGAFPLFAATVAASVIYVITERPLARFVRESLCDSPPRSRVRTEFLCESLSSVSSRIAELERSSCALGQASHPAFVGEKSLERRSALSRCSETLMAVAGAVGDAGRLALPRKTESRVLSESLLRAVRKTGARPSGVSVYSDGSAEVVLPMPSRFDVEKISAKVSEICGSEFSRPERREAGESVMLAFLPKPRFSVEVGTSFLPLGGDPEAPCGDVSATFSCGGSVYCVLSDGMGAGSDAKAAAELLVTLLKEFITAGFSVPTAASLCSLTVSAALPEESFATLDVLKINTYTGMAESFKAGGCPGYMLLDGEPSSLRTGGYPIGILDGCDLKSGRFFIGEKASAIMFTDGALSLSEKRIISLLSEGEPLPAKEVSEGILNAVLPKNDDITVSVVKIRKLST